MIRQNRALAFLFVFSLVLLGWFLWSSGLLQPQAKTEGEITATVPSELGNEMDAMGDPADQVSSPGPATGFQDIRQELAKCFELKKGDFSTPAAPTIESLLNDLQGDWGTPSRQGDRWMTWHLKANEGREKRLRLEVTETDTGFLRRELHAYWVDKDGMPIPLELDTERSQNPSDEIINQMLKDGTVIYKERAGTVQFSEDRRLDFVEVDGTLSEIEAVRQEVVFKCGNLKSRESCTCLK